MNHSHHFPALALSGLLLLSCATSKQDSSHAELIESAKQKIAMDIPPPIAPNTCKVVATVEAIDKMLKGTNEKDPCGKAPCTATIRIDSVIGYGSAFPKTFSAGGRLQARFAFTLSATKETMPDVKPALPGLRVGSKFTAAINASVAMGNSEPSYTIYSYEVK